MLFCLLGFMVIEDEGLRLKEDYCVFELVIVCNVRLFVVNFYWIGFDGGVFYEMVYLVCYWIWLWVVECVLLWVLWIL